MTKWHACKAEIVACYLKDKVAKTATLSFLMGSNAILLDEPKQSAIANLISPYKNRLTTYQLVLILKNAEYL
ncbi:hypothetical protein [Nostoc sp.]